MREEIAGLLLPAREMGERIALERKEAMTCGAYCAWEAAQKIVNDVTVALESIIATNHCSPQEFQNYNTQLLTMNALYRRFDLSTKLQKNLWLRAREELAAPKKTEEK